jgi:hypothetical protein
MFIKKKKRLSTAVNGRCVPDPTRFKFSYIHTRPVCTSGPPVVPVISTAVPVKRPVRSPTPFPLFDYQFCSYNPENSK